MFTYVYHSSNIPSETKSGGNRGKYINKTIDILCGTAKIIIDRVL